MGLRRVDLFAEERGALSVRLPGFCAVGRVAANLNRDDAAPPPVKDTTPAAFLLDGHHWKQGGYRVVLFVM
jgi:hypothetical protein